ncbi:META domain-containing protein [Nocardia panacis]|uniref:META domain-containing protein n=1 Tax=Nocardia panacis TaxID=2340916 RepID=A0A3A4JIR9_9NOCA|nr:META domain-containing protein [Nocardia panacis]RJO68307.1 META domain-containing protein [Nocardia panacis]
MSAKFPRLGPLVLLALCALAACSRGDSEAAQAEPTPMGRTFVSTEIQGAPIPGGGPLTLTFKDGRISADAGCNPHSGAVALDDHKVHVTGMASTLMACPGERQGADEWLNGLLNSRPTWRLDKATLILQGDNLTVTLLDKKVALPDKPIQGTTWIVTALITPDAQIRSQAIDEVKPTLTITPDGVVSGQAGCNRMTGRAAVAGAELTFQVGATKMLCSPEVMEVEQQVLRTLDGKVNASVDADVLTLRKPDGSGLILHAEQ